MILANELQKHYLESIDHPMCLNCLTGFQDIEDYEEVGKFLGRWWHYRSHWLKNTQHMELLHPEDISSRPEYESDSTLFGEDYDDESADENCREPNTHRKLFRSRSSFSHNFASVGKI